MPSSNRLHYYTFLLHEVFPWLQTGRSSKLLKGSNPWSCFPSWNSIGLSKKFPAYDPYYVLSSTSYIVSQLEFWFLGLSVCLSDILQTICVPEIYIYNEKYNKILKNKMIGRVI